VSGIVSIVEIRWLGSECGHVDSQGRPNAGRSNARVHPVSASGHPASSQRLSESYGSINRKVLAWGSLSWHFDILDILVSLSKYLSFISIIDSSS
jgi:hypothetical protein